jgi:hypothetical protein
MSASAKVHMRRINLHAARSKEFPEGSDSHGYEFVAPLDGDGHIDLDLWKANRALCFVKRFWGDADPERGLLVHRAGGSGGSSWAFDYDFEKVGDEETGYHFGDHVFHPGEYVSIRDASGEMATFKVARVEKL